MANDFLIDAAMVINSNAWAINRQLATRISLVPNFSVGSFFQEISDADLKFISEQIETTNLEDDAASELFLLMMLLAQAEGVQLADETIGQKFDALHVFVAVTMMHRQNLVKVNFDNMSFADQMQSCDLVEATEQGMRFMEQMLGGESDAMQKR